MRRERRGFVPRKGESFLSETNVITVSGLTKYIKSTLESDIHLQSFSVSGEISNLTIHRSGHLYFAIKDDLAVLNAVMFRSSAASLTFKPENGMKIIAKGRISVFEPAGRYQIVVTSMTVDGIGDLYIAYEMLKQKLQKEGLFDNSHKSAIPKIPARIGVITSPTGAAVRDIINVTGRRFPFSDILLYPSLVQGEDAPGQLIRALKYFESKRCVDVIIIGRGGGSIEDLWAFNDEKLARTIYNMTIPVISAVGHEIDFTICDFVADMRAPTPSAAAEIAVPNTEDMLNKFSNVNKRLTLILEKKLEYYNQKLDLLYNSRVFTDSGFFTQQYKIHLEHIFEKLSASAFAKIKTSQAVFEKLTAKLDALSPLKIMSRGYLLAQNSSGHLIKNSNDITVSDEILLKLCDGTAGCTVNYIDKDEKNEN